MYTFCATAAPTHHLPGEAHSPSAPAPLVTMFAVDRASEVASRRPAAHPNRPRRPLSSPLSPSATPQLQPAQPLWDRVAQNASGDTRRHAGCHCRAASEKCRHGVAIDWPASRLKDWASSPLRLMENAYLGVAAARGPITSGPVTRSPVAPPVVTHAVNNYAPTPTRPTSSVSCRPKRIRRHQASHDTIRAPLYRLAYAPAGSANQLLDFWIWTRESGNPKVAPVFPANFITAHRETKAQTRLNRRGEERLLDRFYGAPPPRTPIQKSKRTLAATRQRSARRSQIGSNHQQPASSIQHRQATT